MDTLRRIAFVTPHMTNAFSRMIWSSLQDAARDTGIALTAVLGGYLDLPGAPNPKRRLYDLLDPLNFEGAILYSALLGYHSSSESLTQFVRSLGPLPVVSLGVPLPGIPSVALDQAGAVGFLVRHLYEVHGFRRFAFVGGPEGQVESSQRQAGFLEAVASLNIPESHWHLFPGDYFGPAGAAAVRALAEQGDFPVGLVCANDLEAMGALEECRKLGLEVPGQVSLTGFDDIDQAGQQEPGLTSVLQPMILQARQAFQLLRDLMDGVPRGLLELTPPTIPLRGSTGCTQETPLAPEGKAALLVKLVHGETNRTESFQEFLRSWVLDFLTAFEYRLETGNSLVLKAQWDAYFARPNLDLERGVSFPRLFAGLESLYRNRPRYEESAREALMMAGSAEYRKGVNETQDTRFFFFHFHEVEVLISQIVDRKGLAAFPFQELGSLGVVGLALVRFGAPPEVLYFQALWSDPSDPAPPEAFDYPTLLPPNLGSLDRPYQRLVVALDAEASYLGYAVIWMRQPQTFIGNFLATQFAGAIHRIELLERIEEQRETLRLTLEETNRMQEQLVETEKVASLGRLVAGVAHEVNTPLGTGITGASYLLDRLTDLQGQFNAGELSKSGLELFFNQGKEALEGILRNLMKAGELIQAFKGLGLDHGQGEWRPVDLRVLFEDLGMVYAAALSKRGIGFRSEYPEPGVLVYSQPSALVQIVGEFLENAMEHAFPPELGGPHRVLLQVSVQDGNLRLAVTDNGRGLTPDERRHLFDPLFTSKRPQGHAGLGLHLAHQLANRTLGGRMTVASEPGAGSCFLCVVPLKTG